MSAEPVWLADSHTLAHRRHAVRPLDDGSRYPQRRAGPSLCGMESDDWYVPDAKNWPKCKTCLRSARRLGYDR